jgi:kynurenine formamidase
MGMLGRFGIFAACFALLMTLLPRIPPQFHQSHQDNLLAGISSGKTRVLDLSYAINDKLVPWPGDARWFEAQVNATIEKDGYFTRSFWMLEHYGTHLDAPIHFAPGKATVDKIPAKQFFGPAVVVDVRADAARDADYLLPAARLEDWENRHGRIPESSIVLLQTGWSARWPDAGRYRNQDSQGRMHFPGFSVDAVKFLIERKVSGLGCDTLSTDYGASADFRVHHLALGAGLYQLENLSDLSDVPEDGAFLIAAPIKLEGGSGGPVRVFVLIGGQR